MRVATCSLIALLLLSHLTLNSRAEDLAFEQIENVISADINDAARLSGSDVHVQAREGLITLWGTVDSLLDKRMASQFAKRTRGVKAVLNQILIKPTERNDDEIRDDVLKLLTANGATDRPQIMVAVSRGEVSMLGEVDSLAEKRIAEFAAANVSGVTSVINHLTVAMTGGRADIDLQEEIQTLLVHSVYLDDVDVDVIVKDHVAFLSGTVGTVEQQDFAQQIAELPSIQRVDMSKLAVDASAGDKALRKERFAAVSNETIRDVLQRSFRADPLVFDVADSIKIRAEDGMVSLAGNVHHRLEKMKAESLARGVVGVTWVSNELQVQRPENAPSDDEIIRETQAALVRSPYLDRHSFRVHCQGAHVSLFGIVDTELEKQIAGWLADTVTGVVHVNNSLAVEKEWQEKPDEKIKADLERKLKYTLLEQGDAIDVKIENGVAILQGEVDTWRQWQAAMDLALEAGAKTPHNMITVRYHPPHGGSYLYVPR